jgi:hypothetical protein
MGLGDFVDIELVLRVAGEAIARKHPEVSGLLGAPIGEVQFDEHGNVPYRPFERGRIYWTQQHGAFEVHGAILAHYLDLGASASFLKAPVIDERAISDPRRKAAFNDFEGGSIFWQENVGAHEIHGAIRERWASLGSQESYLGYPTSDEHDWTSPTGVEGKASDFQFGQIGWTISGGPVEFPETRSFDTGSITFPGSAPVNGSVQLTIASNGNFNYRFRASSSGLLPLNFSTFAVIATGLEGLAESGIFGLRRTGTLHVIESNDDVGNAGNSGLLRTFWSSMRNGQFTVSMSVRDTILDSISDVTDAIRNAVRNLLGVDPGENIGVSVTGFRTDIREV